MEKIKYWVEKVNEEYNRQDKNSYCIDFFTDILEDRNFIFFFFDFGYLILNIGYDMWGEKFLGVVSFYIDKEKRKNPKLFIKLQKLIECMALSEKVDYIEQGSHHNKRLNEFLEKNGYRKAVYRRYLNGKE